MYYYMGVLIGILFSSHLL